MNRISSIQFNQFLYSISNTGAANDFANSNEEHDISPIEDAAARGKFSKIFLKKIIKFYNISENILIRLINR